MFYDEIERGVHQVILCQLWKEAGKRGLTKEALAEKIGRAENYFSKLATDGSHPRRLTPEMARQIMEELNFIPSQTQAVERFLKSLKNDRNRRRFAQRGLDQLRAGLAVQGSKVCIRLEPIREKRNGIAVHILFETEKQSMSFSITDLATGESNPIQGPEVSEKHLGSKEAVNAILGKIYQALQAERAKTFMRDLRAFDDDELRSRAYNRSGEVDRSKHRLQLIEKAQEILLQHIGLKKQEICA